MARSVTIAAIQPVDERSGSTPAEQKADNVRRALIMVEEAARRGADLVLLPEHFPLTGVDRSAEIVRDLADAEDGPLAEELRSLARRLGINLLAPVTGRYGDTLRNAAWVIDRAGNIAGRYFKVHCTEGERAWGIVSGDEWPIFALDFGRLGVLICHDNSFPESARCLALGGAEILCWPHIQSGWGDVVWDITLRSRAIDSGVYLVSSCYGRPPERSWRPGQMVGRSGIVAPDGSILAEAGRYPGMAITTVDLDQTLIKSDFTRGGEHPFRADVLGDRRPDTYGAIKSAGLRTGSR